MTEIKTKNSMTYSMTEIDHIFYDRNAGMALPRDRSYDLDKESGLLTVENGATTILTRITRSLISVSYVERKVVKKYIWPERACTLIHLMLITTFYKTYYVRDVPGSIQPVTTRIFYVPGLEQDLLGGWALIKAKFRIILNNDPDISGIFPVSDGQFYPATGFPFAESEGLFYLESAIITESKYKSMSGYPLWHRLLSQCSYQTIKDTIPHSLGLHKLEKAHFDLNLKCTACIQEKAHLQLYPTTKGHAKRQLESVYMDIVYSSVTSIEG